MQMRINDLSHCRIEGEAALLLWTASLCYRARLAPSLYNDSVVVGMAVWNQLVWMTLHVVIR